MHHYLIDLHRLRRNPYNGLYTFSVQLTKALIDHVSPDEHLHLYLPRDKFGFFGQSQKYVSNRKYHKYYHFNTEKYDVWHQLTGISRYRPFNKKTKVVYTIHDVNFLEEEPHKILRNKQTIELMQKNVDRADYVVCISKFSLHSAKEHLNMEGKKTGVIYHGYTVQDFTGFDKPVYKPSKPFLFSISLVQPRKNFHVLPPLLRDNDFELVIAGLNHFDYANKVIEEAKRFGVEDRVKLIGAISEKDKYWYYKNCRAFLFPSIAEGFGAPAVEAMHFGKPVFLSTKTCMPEIGGDAAYYFSDFDPDAMRKVFTESMQSFYADSDRPLQVMQHAKKFSWNEAANNYLNVYRSLI